jgi:hypothetical protein
MVCREHSHADIRMALDLSPAAVRTLYPRRRVQSVYLDSPDAQALDDNLAGISHREKIRFRWYGDATGEVTGSLECKVRENQQGWKRTCPIEAPVKVEGASRHDFVQTLVREAAPEWKVRLSGLLEPVQWISYQRDYLVTADRRVRITLDKSLKTWDLRGRYLLSSRFPTPVPDMLIIEVKCAARHHDLAQRLVSSLPLFMDKCSKFVTASIVGGGPEVSENLRSCSIVTVSRMLKDA